MGKRTFIRDKQPPLTDCPFWGGVKNECIILIEPVCKYKTCGFYPPVAEERKRKIREKRK